VQRRESAPTLGCKARVEGSATWDARSGEGAAGPSVAPGMCADLSVPRKSLEGQEALRGVR